MSRAVSNMAAILISSFGRILPATAMQIGCHPLETLGITQAEMARFWHNRTVNRGTRSPRRQDPKSMPMNASDIEKLIKAGIPDAEVTIRDLAGDGDHYAATVIAESFRGKSRVQQHQLVYNALKGQMGGALHALALQTGLPER
jgi:stress-induced morphogen